jgi:hypothetical protein
MIALVLVGPVAVRFLPNARDRLRLVTYISLVTRDPARVIGPRPEGRTLLFDDRIAWIETDLTDCRWRNGQCCPY